MVVCGGGWRSGFAIFFFVHTSLGINLGLISGDLKRTSSPVLINKYSRHTPVFINIHPKSPLNSILPPITPPKLPSKPPPLKLSKISKLKKLSPTSLPSKLPRSLVKPLPSLSPPKIPKLPLIPPKIPKLPLIAPRIPKLPLIPSPLLPRLSPLIPRPHPLLPLPLPLLPRPLPLLRRPLPLLRRPLPLLPIVPPLLPILPIIPRVPRLGSPIKPLKVPILGKKTSLQKALGSELKSVTVPSAEMTRKNNILDKLLELKKRGSLTAAEFFRFKKLLLK